MPDVSENKKQAEASLLASKVPEPEPAADESGEEALDGFVKDAHSWFEEEVLQAKMEKEQAAAEAEARANAELKAKLEEEARQKAEAELKTKLEAERQAREQAEAEAKRAKAEADQAAKAAAPRGDPSGEFRPAAAMTMEQPPPAKSNTGLYFLAGAVILTGGLVFLGLQFAKGGKESKGSSSTDSTMSAPGQHPEMTDSVMTEPLMTEPAMTEPAMTEPAMTEPAMTEPVMTEPVMTEPVMRQAPRRIVRRRPPMRRIKRRRPPMRRQRGMGMGWDNPFG